jgi:signal peptidase I
VLRVLSKIGLNLLFVAMIGCVAIMLGPSVAGYHRYVIMTGSMTGTYNRGSIVFDKPVPTASLKVGDPITYNPPSGFTSQTRESHRIYRITTGKDGVRIFKTKGDANKAPDVWTFTLPRPTQDEVKFHIPEVGYLFLLLSLRNFRMVIVGVPAIAIGLYMMRDLWREAGTEAKRQKLSSLGWRMLADSGSGAVLAPIDAPATHRHFAVLDLGLLAHRDPSDVPEAPPKRRVRLRAGTTLRVNRFGTARRRGAGTDRRQPSSGPGQIRVGGDSAGRPLRIRQLPQEVRTQERVEANETREIGRPMSLV